MRLQLALDHTSLDEALPVAFKVATHVDIIELGTPLIKTAGLNGLNIIRKCFPNHYIVADLKTMDAGEYEATPFFKAGASICTVLGAADEATIRGVTTAARKAGEQVQVDLINVKNKADLFVRLGVIGVDIVGIHTGIDQQSMGLTPFEDLAMLVEIKTRLQMENVLISVAGGINLQTIEKVAEAKPDIIVVGGAITSSDRPALVALEMRRIINCVL